MLINFSTIANLIPKDGRLVLSFAKKITKVGETEEVKEISVVFAQQFKGKENDGDFSPIILSGNIDQLNETFESAVTEISQDQAKLAELKSRPPAGRVDAKKKQLSGAIAKAAKTAAPAEEKENGKKEDQKKEPEKEAPKKPAPVNMFDLFAPKAETPKTDTLSDPAEPPLKAQNKPGQQIAPSVPESSTVEVEEVTVMENAENAEEGAA